MTHTYYSFIANLMTLSQLHTLSSVEWKMTVNDWEEHVMKLVTYIYVPPALGLSVAQTTSRIKSSMLQNVTQGLGFELFGTN
jgi:hypothetical protein